MTRAATVAMGLFFVMCAGLQYNDPDPGLWMLAYLIPAALSFGAAQGRPRQRMAGVAAAVYLVWAVWWDPGSGPEQMPHEAGKEEAGLAIAAGWMALLAWRAAAWRKQKGGGA